MRLFVRNFYTSDEDIDSILTQIESDLIMETALSKHKKNTSEMPTIYFIKIILDHEMKKEESEVIPIVKLFKKYDRNSDGVLGEDELDSFVRDINKAGGRVNSSDLKSRLRCDNQGVCRVGISQFIIAIKDYKDLSEAHLLSTLMLH